MWVTFALCEKSALLKVYHSSKRKWASWAIVIKEPIVVGCKRLECFNSPLSSPWQNKVKTTLFLYIAAERSKARNSSIPSIPLSLTVSVTVKTSSVPSPVLSSFVSLSPGANEYAIENFEKELTQTCFIYYLKFYLVLALRPPYVRSVLFVS